MKYTEQARFLLLVAEAFVALTSIVCGVGMVVGVIQFPLAFLRGAPFSDYTVPGLIMAIVVGGSALLAAATLGAGRPAGIGLAALAGFILLLFEVAEVASIDRNTGAWLPLVVALQSAYSVIGLTMVGLSVFLWESGRHRQLVRVRHAHLG